jgi:hypothetical protein
MGNNSKRRGTRKKKRYIYRMRWDSANCRQTWGVAVPLAAAAYVVITVGRDRLGRAVVWPMKSTAYSATTTTTTTTGSFLRVSTNSRDHNKSTAIADSTNTGTDTVEDGGVGGR